MQEAQREFDQAAMPLAPEHLTSPVLHAVLSWPAIQGRIWGGKGVGSQVSFSLDYTGVTLLSLFFLRPLACAFATASAHCNCKLASCDNVFPWLERCGCVSVKALAYHRL